MGELPCKIVLYSYFKYIFQGHVEMIEAAHVPFKAQNTPKGKVSLNQVTQMEEGKKKKEKHTE